MGTHGMKRVVMNLFGGLLFSMRLLHIRILHDEMAWHGMCMVVPYEVDVLRYFGNSLRFFENKVSRPKRGKLKLHHVLIENASDFWHAIADT